MEAFRYRGDELWCEEVRAADIAAAHGTPAYVYSRQSVIDHCRWIEKSFGGIPHLSCYAVKANMNRAVLALLAGEGIGADAGSIGEMTLALAAGFPAQRITFSGVGKRDDEIAFALRNGVLCLNVESAEELEVIDRIAGETGTTARVHLRVNFDIPSSTHPYITTGRKENKFGVAPGRARAIAREMGSRRRLALVGIHSHIGSQITESATFIRSAETIAAFVGGLRADGIPVGEINFGGGFGVQYRGYVAHPTLPRDEEAAGEAHMNTAELLAQVLPVLRETGCTIFIQPGRSIVAHAGILLMKVLYRKESDEKVFLIVDAGMNDLIRPSLYRSYHQIVPVTVRPGPHEKVDVVGPLCETGDFFALDRAMPAASRGDTLAVLCTGAYGYVLTSRYNGRPRPPEILVEGAGFTVVTPREPLTAL